MDPPVFADKAAQREWDGVVLGRIVTCKGCGAEDRYRLTASAELAITTRIAAERAREPDPEKRRVVEARLKRRDGSTVHRPAQALVELRAACERDPEAGEPWRRLGNMCERFGLMDQAEDAWRRAVEDDEEAESACSLALHLAGSGRLEEGIEFAMTALERMPEVKAPVEHAAMAEALCALLGQTVDRIEPPMALMATWLGGQRGKDVIVHLSSANLRDIRRWDRLAELIGARFFRGLRFTTDLADDPDSQLLALLGTDASASRTPHVRSHAKVGRNDPCPCGSGRKYKKCCLR